MSRHRQESELEFRRNKDNDYPVARGLIVHQYGGELEDCVKKAREEFNLDDEWELVRAEMPKL